MIDLRLRTMYNDILSLLTKDILNSCKQIEEKNSLLKVEGINYNDKSKYVGELLYENRHGIGIYYYNSGSIYRGEWENGNRHGLGMIKFASGNIYIGNWVNGDRQGLGIFIFNTLKVKLDNNWDYQFSKVITKFFNLENKLLGQ